MPGSRLRSEIDMRRGDKAGLPGEVLPGVALFDASTGTG